jgi:hypothetical protein
MGAVAEVIPRAAHQSVCSTSQLSTHPQEAIMAAVSQILFLKPQPGRVEALMRDISKACNIVKRNGGKFRAYNEVSGPNAGTVAVVVEHNDWKDFGSYMTKLESDKDWQAFQAEISSTKAPNAEMVSTGINVEVPS